MTSRSKQLTMKGQIQHRHEADKLLAGAGTAVVVHRGVARSLVLVCPDGCGEILTINLDPRAGKAWRLYTERRGTSLFPSVWRPSGCKSHFIVWRSHIYWCDYDDESMDDENEQLEQRIAAVLDSSFRSYADIAQNLAEIPWAVLVACGRLVKRRIAESGTGQQQGSYRRLQPRDI
jgi:hypothetical protein